MDVPGNGLQESLDNALWWDCWAVYAGTGAGLMTLVGLFPLRMFCGSMLNPKQNHECGAPWDAAADGSQMMWETWHFADGQPALCSLWFSFSQIPFCFSWWPSQPTEPWSKQTSLL